MNISQYEVCTNIMNNLSRRPIYSLFYDLKNDSSPLVLGYPVNLKKIYLKLQRNLYSDCNSWINEVTELFNYFINNYKDEPLISASAQQLLKDFNEELEKTPPNKDGFALRLSVLSSDILEIAKIYETEHVFKKTDKQPHCYILNKDIKNITTKDLIRQIKALHSTDLILRVAAFLYKLQPECVNLDYDVSIEFEQMSEETLSKLKLFVRSLLIKAAQGQVCPFKRPYDPGISAITNE